MSESTAAELPEPHFTYADYAAWPEEERWELIGGRAYAMSPAPRRVHQQIVGALYRQVQNQLEGGPCEGYVSPFDVRLPEPLEETGKASNVVQPDVSVFCDREKLDDAGAVGAPAFVAEIISPSTRRKDRGAKLDLYERHGVKEYWIVDPELRSVEIWLLDENGVYGEAVLHRAEGTVELASVPGVTVDLAALFAAMD